MKEYNIYCETVVLTFNDSTTCVRMCIKGPVGCSNVRQFVVYTVLVSLALMLTLFLL